MKQRHLFLHDATANNASHRNAGVCAAALLLFITGTIFWLPAKGRAQSVSPQQPTQTTQDGRPRRADSTTRTQTNQQSSAPTLARPVPTPNASATPPVLQPTQGQEIGDDDEPIRVETNLVNLNVRVIDRNNRPINNVPQSEFHVFENGVPQPVQFFSKEDVPISYGLAIDVSGSIRTQLEKVQEAAKTIIASNKPGDETFLETFIDREKVELKQDFTSDQDKLGDALDDLYVTGGQTAVIDGVYLAADHVAEYKKGNDLNDRRRRALIVVTDGEDRESFYKQEQLFARLREEDVQIYVIGFVGELDDDKEGVFKIRKSAKQKAVTLINRLASETGGRAFFPTSTNELPGIAQEITRDLRTQYVIGYSPTNKARDGSYRAVRVAVGDEKGRDKRIALTRGGYYAPREGGQTTAPATTRINNQSPAAPIPRRKNP